MTRAALTAFLLAALLVAATASDCLAQGQIGEDAMACCRSMSCAPTKQTQDCCKNMVPAPRTYFVVPARTFAPVPSVQVAVLKAVVIAAAPLDLDRRSEARQHAPPGELLTLCQSLRI